LKSTGVYGYPFEPAAQVAIATAREMTVDSALQEVIFCCFSQPDFEVYQRLLARAD
jgi:O-acetyl-ADP-ribose deacetylase (regulator of RNase III)